MPCQLCNKKCGVPIECLYCKGNFCPRCTHLEKHNCQGINIKINKQLEELKNKIEFKPEPKVYTI